MIPQKQKWRRKGLKITFHSNVQKWHTRKEGSINLMKM